jgi:hypothetical protein
MRGAGYLLFTVILSKVKNPVFVGRAIYCPRNHRIAAWAEICPPYLANSPYEVYTAPDNKYAMMKRLSQLAMVFLISFSCSILV